MVLLIIKKKNINSSNYNRVYFMFYSKDNHYYCYSRFVRVFEQESSQEDIFSAVSEPVIDKYNSK